MVQTKKWWFINIANLLTIGLILFTASGTFDWLMAWLYVVLITGFNMLSHIMNHPKLHKKWDVLPLAMLLIAGLDKRFEWSTVPILIQSIACFLLLVGVCIGLWATKTNIFYAESVRIQYERHHVVISDGPYRYVRHPGYTGYIIASIATPLMLGSLTALIPSSFIVIGYVARTIFEDVKLQRQFKGYYDYTKKVPYRLLPGIW